MPTSSLIAFKACYDLGLGPHPIVAGCSNNGKKQVAVERGGAASAGALFGGAFKAGNDIHKKVLAMMKNSNSIGLNNSVQAVFVKLTILYKWRTVAEVQFGPKIKISERITEKV
jgi:hypothetical protein